MFRLGLVLSQFRIDKDLLVSHASRFRQMLYNWTFRVNAN